MTVLLVFKYQCFYFKVVYICIYILLWVWDILREEHRLWMLENRVLRNVFGAKWDDIRGDSRKIHNEKLCDVYC